MVRQFTILIADDHPSVREGLISMLDNRSDMRVVAEATNGAEAIEKFFTVRPDLAVIDIRMPVMGGVAAVASICEREPTARLVVFTSYGTEEDIYRALRAGAQGYLLKTAARDEIVSCILAVANGGTWIPPEIEAQLARRSHQRELTKREMDVLKAVAAGKSNKEIAVLFNISEKTVKAHLTHILEKLRVTRRAEAMNVAAKRGLVHLGSNGPPER